MNDYKIITESLIDENVNLKNELDLLKSKLNNLETKIHESNQTKNSHSLQLCGIPLRIDENLTKIG